MCLTWTDCPGCGSPDGCAHHVALQAILFETQLMLVRTCLKPEVASELFGARPGSGLQRWSTTRQAHVRCHFRVGFALFVDDVNIATQECHVYAHVADDETPTCKAVSYVALRESTPMFAMHYPSVDEFIQQFSKKHVANDALVES